MALPRIIALAIVCTLCAGLLALPQSSTAQPLLGGTVNPPQGPPETVFRFAASGFDTGAEVAYWITRPGGEVIGNADDFLLYANNQGRIDWQWQAPGDAVPGIWMMAAQQIDDDLKVAQIPFEIVPYRQPAPSPVPPTSAPPGTSPPVLPAADTQISIDPPVGSTNTTFTIAASGFEPGEKTGYWFNAPDGTVVGNAEEFLAFANSQGQVEFHWNATYYALPGTWSVVVRGVTSGVERRAGFIIRP